MSGWVAGSVIGAAVIGGAVQQDAASKQAKATKRANQAAIAAGQEADAISRADRQPFAEIGLEAADEIRALRDDPMASLEEINPVVDFLRKEGFEEIQESAAAAGRLGAGGTLEDLTRFNTDLTSTVVPQLQNQKFNQLFNLLSLGSNAASGQATGTQSTAVNTQNLLSNTGVAQGNAAINRSNAITDALSAVPKAVGAFNTPAPAVQPPAAAPVAAPPTNVYTV